ncbi:MAG: C39 family peptidase [Armatimonadetes bacterium]|nr:C39 family peptidase [Armatimonadota bacterium]
MVGAVALGLAALANTPSVARLVRVPLRVNFPETGEVHREFNNIKPGITFDEVIPSWNFDNATNGAIRIELRINTPTGKSKWYVLGDWSGDKDWSPRQSTEKQKDDDGNVLTDTFRAAKPTDSVDLKVTLKSRGQNPQPKLKLLTLCFSDTSTVHEYESWPTSPYWGSLTDVPQRAQNNYPNGGVLCSATSTSMLLWHYSKVLNRPEIDHDVPEVEANVWDPVYDGAGNWPFNTAYFGSFSGLRACVSRFTSIEDLEVLTKAGIPVACSVSLDILEGKNTGRRGGHLVIVVGFEDDGTPIFNDPAFKTGVRKTYKRDDFERAWCYSDRTVYLMVPDNKKLPPDPHKVWSFR